VGEKFISHFSHPVPNNCKRPRAFVIFAGIKQLPTRDVRRVDGFVADFKELDVGKAILVAHGFRCHKSDVR
jgi:hypothetical protein